MRIGSLLRFSPSGVRSVCEADRSVPERRLSHPGRGHHGIQLHRVCVSALQIRERRREPSRMNLFVTSFVSIFFY